MLFAFDSDRSDPFWNDGTLIPLDVGFYDAAGTLIDVFDLPSLTETRGQIRTTPRPRRPYRHVLEANRGWFMANGLRPGSALPRLIFSWIR